jgi:AraC family transcriptional regulator
MTTYSRDAFPHVIDGPIPARSRDRGRGGSSAEAAVLLDDVLDALERNPGGARATALWLVALLIPPAGAGSEGSRGGLAPRQKRKVERYLREHLGHPLPIKELAEQVPLSVSHFCRAFKESFGTTPHMHITRLRVELAQRLMLTTEDQLTHIALTCGLADQAHLSKLFRREVGETPSSWRRRNVVDARGDGSSRRSRGADS